MRPSVPVAVGLGPSVPVPSRSGCPVRQISRRIRSRSSKRCARSSSSADVKTLMLTVPSGSADSSGLGSVSSGPSRVTVSSSSSSSSSSSRAPRGSRRRARSRGRGRGAQEMVMTSRHRVSSSPKQTPSTK
uniref:Uncharacterized protein n=1 Tax=Myotis lucifugus TaxID=59463 RepID=L7N1B3_MYOLU